MENNSSPPILSPNYPIMSPLSILIPPSQNPQNQLIQVPLLQTYNNDKPVSPFLTNKEWNELALEHIYTREHWNDLMDVLNEKEYVEQQDLLQADPKSPSVEFIETRRVRPFWMLDKIITKLSLETLEPPYSAKLPYPTIIISPPDQIGSWSIVLHKINDFVKMKYVVCEKVIRDEFLETKHQEYFKRQCRQKIQ